MMITILVLQLLFFLGCFWFYKMIVDLCDDLTTRLQVLDADIAELNADLDVLWDDVELLKGAEAQEDTNEA
jgi:hypothetical protein